MAARRAQVGEHLVTNATTLWIKRAERSRACSPSFQPRADPGPASSRAHDIEEARPIDKARVPPLPLQCLWRLDECHVGAGGKAALARAIASSKPATARASVRAMMAKS